MLILQSVLQLVLQLLPTFIMLGVFVLVVVATLRRTWFVNARYRLGTLATRIGFQIIEGSPDDNLVRIPIPSLSMRVRLPFQRTPWTGLSARLAGSVRGRNAVLRVLDQHCSEGGLLGRSVYTRFDGHLAIEVRTPFPAFEVISRSQHAIMAPDSKLAAPLASFGDAQLDAALILRTSDPQIAPVIREAMRSMLAVHWVCVRGEEGRVVYDCVPTTKTMLFDCAEPVLMSLAQTAEAIEAAVAAYYAQQTSGQVAA